MLLGSPDNIAHEEESVKLPDFVMTYYNSDGSGGMMCGNGGRCIVAFAADMGIRNFRFQAADGYHSAEILSSEGAEKIISLDMNDVRSYDHYDRLSGVSVPSDGYFMDTGTRHFVRIVDGLDGYDVVSEGRDIRYNARELQPVGVNVNFIEQDGSVLKVRTYEKGVEDETYACGTGIVASCIAAYKAGIHPSELLSENRVRYDVKAKKDRLSVIFRPSDSDKGVAEAVRLIGPATFVAEINCEI
jgi:diaminopimelate epimerase